MTLTHLLRRGSDFALVPREALGAKIGLVADVRANRARAVGQTARGALVLGASPMPHAARRDANLRGGYIHRVETGELGMRLAFEEVEKRLRLSGDVSHA